MPYTAAQIAALQRAGYATDSVPITTPLTTQQLASAPSGGTGMAGTYAGNYTNPNTQSGWNRNLSYQRGAAKNLQGIGNQYAQQGLQNPWLQYQPGSYGQTGYANFGGAGYSDPNSQFVRDTRASLYGSANRAAQNAGKTLSQAQRASRGVSAYGGGAQEGSQQRAILDALLAQDLDINKSAMDYGFQRAGQALQADQIGANAYSSLYSALPGILNAGVNQNQLYLQGQGQMSDDMWRQAMEQSRRADQDLEWDRTGKAAADYEAYLREQQKYNDRIGKQQSYWDRMMAANDMLNKQERYQLADEAARLTGTTGLSPEITQKWKAAQLPYTLKNYGLL